MKKKKQFTKTRRITESKSVRSTTCNHSNIRLCWEYNLEWNSVVKRKKNSAFVLLTYQPWSQPNRRCAWKKYLTFNSSLCLRVYSVCFVLCIAIKVKWKQQNTYIHEHENNRPILHTSFVSYRPQTQRDKVKKIHYPFIWRTKHINWFEITVIHSKFLSFHISFLVDSVSFLIWYWIIAVGSSFCISMPLNDMVFQIDLQVAAAAAAPLIRHWIFNVKIDH